MLKILKKEKNRVQAQKKHAQRACNTAPSWGADSVGETIKKIKACFDKYGCVENMPFNTVSIYSNKMPGKGSKNS